MFNHYSFHGKTAHGVDVDQTYGMADRRQARICFVVANRGVAHILEKTVRTEPPTLLQTIENPEARSTEISSDARGRVFQSTHTGSRSAYERTTPALEATQEFCRRILKQVQRIAKGADHLVFVASPHFLGTLRNQLKKHPVETKQISDYVKDLSKVQPKDLPVRLQALLQSTHS